MGALRTPRAKVITAVLLASVLPCLASAVANYVFGEVRYVQEQLHEFLELTGACIALGVAMLLLLRVRYEEATPHLLWVIAALVAMGLMSGVHCITKSDLAWSQLQHGATLLGGLLFGMVWLPVPAAVARRRNLSS